LCGSAQAPQTISFDGDVRRGSDAHTRQVGIVVAAGCAVKFSSKS
jgi:hypothetical protein